VTQEFNNELERFVRLHPEQWMWIHRRWKKFCGQLNPGMMFQCIGIFRAASSSASEYLWFWGCASRILQYDKAAEVLKTDEYDKKVQVKQVEPPPTP